MKVNTDRIDIYQLELCNRGKVTAYDIKIKWNNELLDSNDESLFKEKDAIEYLLPGESLIRYMGICREMFKRRKEKYECILEYMDKNRKRFSEKFSINLIDYSKTLFTTTEEIRASKAIQEIESIMRKNSNI